MKLFAKSILWIFCILFTSFLPCNAGNKIIIAENIYIEESSIKKIKNNNNEIIYSYIKRINKDKNNKYKIPFFDDKDNDYNRQSASIGYDIKTNCKKRTVSIEKIYLYNQNNDIIKRLNVKTEHKSYIIPVKNNKPENGEYKILCESGNKGFFRKSDEF